MFQISVVNRSKTVADIDLHRVVRAINRQVQEDFAPYWAFGGSLRVEGPASGKIDPKALREMRGDAVIYLLDSASNPDTLGYHDKNLLGIPYGFVYLDLCAQLGESWSTTLSHESLELIGDPNCNLLVQGPNPNGPGLPNVFHYFEMCDAVQSQTYEIDGVTLSNFVLPAYFSPSANGRARNDFIGSRLSSFGVNPGGYVGFFDPEKPGGGASDTYFADDASRLRYRVKAAKSLPEDQRPTGRIYRRQLTANKNPVQQEKLSQNGMVRMATDSGAVTLARQDTPDVTIDLTDPIKHVIVLMLENRSFDHMLGGLYQSIGGLDGVDPRNPHANLDVRTNAMIKQDPIARSFVSTNFNVPHEFSDVQRQLSNGMGNFVNSYRDANPAATEDEVAQVMAYFKDGDLPVLHSLAKNYLVCDRWFSSLPGPTWPNRLFVHSGTSLGHVLMPNADDPSDVAQLWGTYNQETIFDRLDRGMTDGTTIPWKIYHNGFPQSAILDHLKESFLTKRFGLMGSFFEDAKSEESFPAYAFIEPKYSNGLFGKENDQHPPAGTADGEALIASVYDAVRSNDALWRSTLLIVTYDEHGGFYDHVNPPAAVPPDASQSVFDFARLGVRVPTILISPYVAKGCDHNVYDHTSILKYLLEKYALEPLGERTKDGSDPREVGNFRSQFLKAPRDDADTLPPFGKEQHLLGALIGESQTAHIPVTPDNARRVLLAMAEKMRARTESVRFDSTTALQTDLPPPKDGANFETRTGDIDKWIEDMDAQRRGIEGPNDPAKIAVSPAFPGFSPQRNNGSRLQVPPPKPSKAKIVKGPVHR